MSDGDCTLIVLAHSFRYYLDKWPTAINGTIEGAALVKRKGRNTLGGVEGDVVPLDGRLRAMIVDIVQLIDATILDSVSGRGRYDRIVVGTDVERPLGRLH